MPDENLIFLKPAFTGGFDFAHEIQALSACRLMKAPKLCVTREEKKTDIKGGVTLMGGLCPLGA